MGDSRSKYHLQKLVNKLRDFEYTVRFEKGNFKTGYCVLEHKKVIVVNKFHDTDSKIGNLRKILSDIRAKAA